VTPWLVDILDEDFAACCARIHRWLRPGGLWINSGSLFFQHADAARCYSTEEVLAIVRDAGFDEPAVGEQEVPYLASPASRHARQERLFTFRAQRDAQDRPAPRPHVAAPDWITRDDLPVPLLPEISSRVLAMRVYAFVASLVDGRRTLRDIAEVLVRERLMTAVEAEPAVRAFVQRLFDEAQAPWRP
jgi:spermidine synthase